MSTPKTTEASSRPLPFILAEYLRQCDAVAAGALDTLNAESLLLIENKLATAMMHVRGIRVSAVDVRPRFSSKQRRTYLSEFARKHNLHESDSYEMLEQRANQLKREGFYSMNTISADIVRRLRDAAAGINGGTQQ